MDLAKRRPSRTFSPPPPEVLMSIVSEPHLGPPRMTFKSVPCNSHHLRVIQEAKEIYHCKPSPETKEVCIHFAKNALQAEKNPLRSIIIFCVTMGSALRWRLLLIDTKNITFSRKLSNCTLSSLCVIWFHTQNSDSSIINRQ